MKIKQDTDNQETKVSAYDTYAVRLVQRQRENY